MNGLTRRYKQISRRLYHARREYPESICIVDHEIERRLYRNIESEAQQQGCIVIALNGVEDHVHLLVSFRTTIAVADLVKQVKGVSSHFVNDELRLEHDFK